MDRWTSRALCVVLVAATWWLSGTVDGVTAAVDGADLPVGVLLLATVGALVVAWRAGLVERWVLLVLLLVELPVAAAAFGIVGDDGRAVDLAVALLWLSPVPLLLSCANETTTVLAPGPARRCLVVGSCVAVGVLVAGVTVDHADLELRLVAVGCLALVVLALLVAWGRPVLVWNALPGTLFAAMSVLALLVPDDGDGMLLLVLLTTPSALGWAAFAAVAWPRLPAAALSGASSTE